MTLPLLEVQQVSKQFFLRKQTVYAVQDISFSLSAGQILGLGGESGCGKTTVGKLLMHLMKPTSGSILFNGQDLQSLSSDPLQRWRRHIQMIFQHPASSLNPRMTVEKIIAEPFVIHGLAKEIKDKTKLISLLSQVGLSEDYLSRLPHELSGGQKQRVAIARALALEPRLLICDEPFSALDVSIQAQIINLLASIQRKRELSYLIISHDLSILRYMAHQMAIMYLGQIVEWGPSAEVYQRPLHPYSQALVSAVLVADPVKARQSSGTVFKSEVPSLTRLPQGCPFYARCPHAQKVCQTVKPRWKEVKPNHFTACHLY